MLKQAVALVGAISAVVALDAAPSVAGAAPAVLEAQSFADLLQPIPNASATLRAMDSSEDAQPVLILAANGPATHHHHQDSVTRHIHHDVLSQGHHHHHLSRRHHHHRRTSHHHDHR